MAVKMITEKKERVKNKSVLLFSGGMDSVIFNKLLNPDVLLYVNSGVNYEKEEQNCLNNLIEKNYIDKSKLVILKDVVNLSQWERDDKIIPNRNAILMMLSSLYGETLYLGSVSGDRSFDKDDIFYIRMEDLLNHMWEEQHWTEKRTFKILSPYKDTTKTELVKKYIKQGNDPQSLFISFSCYDPKDGVACGFCKPCFRKWVSLVNNNVAIPDGYFVNNPALAPWIKEVEPLIRQSKWRGKEDPEIMNALQKAFENNIDKKAEMLADIIIKSQK